MMPKLDIMPDARPLLAESGGWPLDLEVLCNLPLSAATRLVARGLPTPYQAVPRQGERPVGLAVQTPREVFLALDAAGVSQADILELAELIADDFAARFEPMPDLFGPEVLIEHMVPILEERRALTAKSGGHNIFYRLEQPIAPARPAAGHARPATEADHAIVARWLDAFTRDAGLPAIEAAPLASYFIAAGDVLLWLDGGGEIVSMAAVSGRTGRCSRVGYVYTPEDHRGRGYGAAITDATTRHALESCETCCLFADRDNALTNRLYRRLGYRRVQEFADVSFS